MTALTNHFNLVTAPLVAQCQQTESPQGGVSQPALSTPTPVKTAMKADLTELKAACDALSARLATQIATIP